MFLFEENGYYGILCFQNGETLVLDLDEMSESIVGDPELTKTIDELQKRVYKAEKKYEEAKNVEERAINDIRVAENNILRANRELKRVEADAIKNEQIAVQQVFQGRLLMKLLKERKTRNVF